MGRFGSSLEFPFLALLVSGGHCQILRCDAMGKYSVVGGTLDDSLGEAYDKVARMLNLPVGGGGGPAVEKLALSGDPSKVRLPIPMQRRKDCDFSFAGLKNAFRVAVEKLKELRNLPQDAELSFQDKADLAASFQHVAIKHLEQRINRAMDGVEANGEGDGGDDDDAADNEDEKIKRRLVVVGGVAANKAIRASLEGICDSRDWEFHVPPARLCTDNGVMAAWAGVEKLKCGISDVAKGQEVYARYPFAS